MVPVLGICHWATVPSSPTMHAPPGLREEKSDNPVPVTLAAAFSQKQAVPSLCPLLSGCGVLPDGLRRQNTVGATLPCCCQRKPLEDGVLC